MKDILKPEPGTYILVLKVKTPQKIEIGKIGQYKLEKGHYIYIGSAHGPGGVKSRVGRHLKSHKTMHWHIDYLRNSAAVVYILISYSKKKKECKWASKLSTFPYLLTRPIKGFGSSDCVCPSHLFFCKGIFNINLLKDIDEESIEMLKIP